MAALADLMGRCDPDPYRRGKQFERIFKWFLTNDPVYKRQLRQVWLWNEWPGRWGADAGIDLVAEDRHGHLWAIQAKAYDAATWITKRDVDTFLAESGRSAFSFRVLIATTDLVGRTAKRTIEGQEKQASILLLGDLEAAEVDWPSSPSDLRPRRLPPKRPRPHQRQAINKVVKGFDGGDRGQLIMACGTGKTLAALFINEKLAAQRTLVLVPSLSLLAQTLHEWTANTKVGFDFLPVCSDETVTVAEPDAVVENTSGLGFPVTTDPEEIATFLRGRSGPRVVFATYQSSPEIAKAFALGRVPMFDLAIADEAHRCAVPVSSDFATILDSEAIKAHRRLFMTATPRYFTGRVVRKAQEADFEVASMDNEEAFGPVSHPPCANTGRGTPAPQRGRRVSADSCVTSNITVTRASRSPTWWMATSSVVGSTRNETSAPEESLMRIANNCSRGCPVGAGTPAPTNGRRVSADSSVSSTITVTPASRSPTRWMATRSSMEGNGLTGPTSSQL